MQLKHSCCISLVFGQSAPSIGSCRSGVIREKPLIERTATGPIDNLLQINLSTCQLRRSVRSSYPVSASITIKFKVILLQNQRNGNVMAVASACQI